ncbi:DUF4136 domain-containing protein [bacterium]|nr:DUF4136 domain-containing protein [bacterium]
MNRATLAVLCVLCGALCGCAALTVTSDFDPAVDFNRFATFAWDTSAPAKSGNPYIDNELFAGRIHRIVYKELVEHGMRYDENNPDLRIAYEASAEERVDVTSVYEYGPPYIYRPRAYPRRYFDLDEATRIEETYYNELTLILQFSDASDNHLVWQGVAHGQYDLRASSSEHDRILTEAVKSMIKDFSALKTGSVPKQQK